MRGCKNIKDKKLGAYMSLEASIIVPAAVFSVALIVFLAFLSYGRCILAQDVYLLGFRADLFYEVQGYGSAKDYIVGHLDEQTSGMYFGSTDPEITVSESGKKIELKGTIKTNHAGLGSYFGESDKIWNSYAAAGIKRNDTPKSARKVKRMIDASKMLIGNRDE